MFKLFKSIFSKRNVMTRKERNVRQALAQGEALNFVARAYALTNAELYEFTR